MAPELGIFSLILAFVLSLSQAFFGLTGAWRGKPAWMAVARPAVTGQFVFVAMAFACLVYSFVNNDFSVLYVARNSNSQLPLFYKVAALWGAHEGSLLLWIMILSIWSVAVAAFSRQLPLSLSSRVLGVIGPLVAAASDPHANVRKAAVAALAPMYAYPGAAEALHAAASMATLMYAPMPGSQPAGAAEAGCRGQQY